MRRSVLYALVTMLLLGMTASAYAKPPRWAPAHGYRRRHRVRVVRTVYTPAPFVYLGTTYIPLRTATSLVGAALLWNSLDGRALVTYNGEELGLVIGSPAVLIGGETVVLSAAPIIVRDTVFVPVDFCERYLEVPVRHSGRAIRLEGHEGWKEYRVASRPPGRVVVRGPWTRKAVGHVERAPRQVRVRGAGHKVKSKEMRVRRAEPPGLAKKRGGGPKEAKQGHGGGKMKKGGKGGEGRGGGGKHGGKGGGGKGKD